MWERIVACKNAFKALKIKTENGTGIDDWYEASGLAGAPFSKLKRVFSSDWDSGIQNPPTGPPHADMRFLLWYAYSCDGLAGTRGFAQLRYCSSVFPKVSTPVEVKYSI